MTSDDRMREALSALFVSRNIALIGATDRSVWSRMIIRRFADFGHQGRLFAVNREGNEAHGLPGYRSCSDIPEPIDLAFIYVPAPAVAAALEDAAGAGVRQALVLTSGFSEAGEEGEALQRQLVETARRVGVTMLGPNSLGFANIAARSVATAIATRLPVLTGSVSVVSQSGAVANEIAKFAHQQGLGLNFLCATGNEAMVSAADVIEMLVDDPATQIIVGYLEGVANPERLRAAGVRAMAASKPIILIKVGTAPISADLSLAHTGADVGDDAAFDADCRELGLIRVRSMEEMIVTAALIEKTGPLATPGVAMVSVSGGACGIYADLAHLHGLAMPEFAASTKARLKEVLPSFAATLNPLDTTGVLLQDPSLWTRVLPAIFDDPNIGLVVSILNFPGDEAEVAIVKQHWPVIAETYRRAGRRPILLTQVLQPVNEVARGVIAETGLDGFVFGLDTGVRALAHLARWSRRLQEAGR